MKAMILAAGRGERMMPLTATTPKPLLKVAGKPLLQYHIERLRDAGIKEIVINHCYHGEQIETYFGNGEQFGVSILWSRETTALETAGGIYQALPLLGEAPFIIVNADVWTNFTFEKLIASPHIKALKQQKYLAHLLLVTNPVQNPAGDFALADGKIRNQGLPMWTYSGIAVLHPALLAECTLGQIKGLAPLLRNFAKSDQISGELISEAWQDIGTPRRLAEIQATQAMNSKSEQNHGQ